MMPSYEGESSVRSRLLAGRMPSLVSLVVAAVGGLAMVVPAAAQAVAPFAETLPPGAIRFDQALLGGRVYAGGEATTYYVEYGKTASYGSQVPAAPGDAGSGSASTAALRTHVVSGLEPETTYHYRLVATNASGTSEGPDLTFTTPPIPSSGSERAYEQVSPAQKNGWAPYYGYDGQAAYFPAGLSRDGERAAFASWGMFAGASGGGMTTYRSTRTDSGWITEPISPPVSDPQGTMLSAQVNTLYRSTRDLDAETLLTTDPIDPEVPRLEDTQDVYARGVMAPKWQLVTVGNNGERVAPRSSLMQLGALAVADGGRTVLLWTHDELVPGSAVPGVAQLYLRRRGVTIHIPMPNGGPAPSAPGTKTGGILIEDAVNERAMLSDDGSRVTFIVGNQVYQWVEGEGTRWVSEPETAITPPTVTLVRPSRDGKRILMRVPRGASRQLTADGSVDGGFYEYVDDGEGGDLRYRGGELLAGTIFTGEMVASHDLDVVYYQVFFSDGDREVVELRRLAGSSYETIARDTSTGLPILQTSGREVIDTNVTPEGSGLLFYTRANIAAYDNGGKAMTYLYNEKRGLQCLSCRPDGLAPARGMPGIETKTSRVSDDGSRAQFSAFDPLVSGDVNNRYDVYEWHDGQISLLSSGRSDQDSFTVGMSADGRDAVFATSESLVWQDRDGGDIDFYDARIGGGFGPEPPRPPAPCVGEACQGAPPAAPALSGTSGSEAFHSAGNVSQASVRVSRVRVVRGSVTRLRVRVSGAGRVSISGRSVRGSTRSAAGTRRVALPVALTKSGRRTLRRRGSVVVPVRVSFRASDGEAVTRVVVVTFKRLKNGGR